MNAFKITSIASLFLLSLNALAKPATTIKIEDQISYEPPTASSNKPDRHWFVRADVSADLSLKGAEGFTASAGRFGKIAYFDFAASYQVIKYGAIRVNQSGNLDSQTEIGRVRNDVDTGSIVSAGPGVGMIARLFGSERWLQMFRLGLNYSLFSDTPRNLKFHGALANFEGRFGYRLGSFIFAPGLSWNMGFYQRTSATSNASATSTAYPSDKFLPAQWWAASLSIYFWL